MKREVPMNKQLLAAVLLCGVACGGSATSQGEASGGTAGQNAAAGTGAVAGLGATSGMGANAGFDATSGQGGTPGAGGAGSSSAGVAGRSVGSVAATRPEAAFPLRRHTPRQHEEFMDRPM